MRINKYIALSTGLSRRAADELIASGRVSVNNQPPETGQQIAATDAVTLDHLTLTPPTSSQTIMLNKPAGYVCSRNGQGSRTIYDVLPERYHDLKSVGRLDKDSTGLLLLTNDGELANELTHPSFKKVKIYEVTLNTPLEPLHHQLINDHGVQLADGSSRLSLMKIGENASSWQVTMNEGRNRQIRRTFESLGYQVTRLHRTQFGKYQLGTLAQAQIKEI